MWKVSNWGRLWSVSSTKNKVYFSHDGLRIFAADERKYHAYNAWSGNPLDEVDSIPESMYDHVHLVIGEIQGKWKCAECESPLLGKDKYFFFTDSNHLPWMVKEHAPKCCIPIPATFEISKPVKVAYQPCAEMDCSCWMRYVYIGCVRWCICEAKVCRSLDWLFQISRWYWWVISYKIIS